MINKYKTTKKNDRMNEKDLQLKNAQRETTTKTHPLFKICAE